MLGKRFDYKVMWDFPRLADEVRALRVERPKLICHDWLVLRIL